MNDLYIIVVIIALGFAYIATKLKRLTDICGLGISMQLGQVKVMSEDGKEYSDFEQFLKEMEEEDEEDK